MFTNYYRPSSRAQPLQDAQQQLQQRLRGPRENPLLREHRALQEGILKRSLQETDDALDAIFKTQRSTIIMLNPSFNMILNEQELYANDKYYASAWQNKQEYLTDNAEIEACVTGKRTRLDPVVDPKHPEKQGLHFLHRGSAKQNEQKPEAKSNNLSKLLTFKLVITSKSEKKERIFDIYYINLNVTAPLLGMCADNYNDLNVLSQRGLAKDLFVYYPGNEKQFNKMPWLNFTFWLLKFYKKHRTTFISLSSIQEILELVHNAKLEPKQLEAIMETNQYKQALALAAELYEYSLRIKVNGILKRLLDFQGNCIVTLRDNDALYGILKNGGQYRGDDYSVVAREEDQKESATENRNQKNIVTFNVKIYSARDLNKETPLRSFTVYNILFLEAPQWGLSGEENCNALLQVYKKYKLGTKNLLVVNYGRRWGCLINIFSLLSEYEESQVEPQPNGALSYVEELAIALYRYNKNQASPRTLSSPSDLSSSLSSSPSGSEQSQDLPHNYQIAVCHLCLLLL